MGWLIKDKLETTGDFTLDAVLRRIYKKELQEEYTIKRVSFDALQRLEYDHEVYFSYIKSYEFKEFMLFLATDPKEKMIYIFMDTKY